MLHKAKSSEYLKDDTRPRKHKHSQGEILFENLLILQDLGVSCVKTGRHNKTFLPASFQASHSGAFIIVIIPSERPSQV